MKKLIYTAAFLSLSVFGYGQDFLNNGDFEVWITQNTVSEPRGWYTLNSLSLFGLPQTTIQTSDAHSGASAALLESTASALTDLPGLLTSALIIDGTGNPDLNLAKVPFTARPESFEFYYKYLPADGDSCSGIMILTRWNEAEQRTDTIGYAGFTSGDSLGIYTRMKVDFTYNNPLRPDSAMIIIASSADGFNPTPGSKLYIDDFKLTYSTGLNKSVSLLKDVSLFPNPAKNTLTIETKESNFSYRISDISGREILSGVSTKTNQTLNVTGITQGIYFLKVESRNGVSTQRLVIE